MTYATLIFNSKEQFAPQVVRGASCCLLSLGFLFGVGGATFAQRKPAPTPAAQEAPVLRTNASDPSVRTRRAADSTPTPAAAAVTTAPAPSLVAEDLIITELRAQIESAANETDRARLERVLVDRLIELNRGEEARSELRRMAQAEDFDPVRYYNVGNALARFGDTESAITAYRKAIAQKRGNYARAQNNLGVVLMRVGRWDEAYEAFTSALRSENFIYAEASYNLGRLYALRGETELGIRELRRTLKLQPGHVDAAIALARLYAAEGDMERSAATLSAVRPEDDAARRRIDEARNLIASAAVLAADTEGKSPVEIRSPAPVSAPASSPKASAAASPRRLTLEPDAYDLLQRARTAREKARYTEAVTLYRRVIAEQNNYFAPANLELGYSLISLKQYEEATVALEAVAAKDGARLPIVYYHLGRLYELRGQTDRAAENYSRAVAAFGDKNPQFMLDVSRVRERQGNLPAAIAAMDSYVQANVKQGRADDWAMTRLATLRQKLAASSAQNAVKQ
ncbi:MAG: tetratricopeptide repeat protein [Pyrinomonadaceae bacterium]|nr:tetratricopeptide repeat protein [Pyrinomonadaceae bacterium]